MPHGLKETTISSSLFPDVDDERVEHAPGTAVAGGKKKGKKGGKIGRVYRDLREDGEDAAAPKTTPPSTQPSTRRSSLTAINPNDHAEKGDKEKDTSTEGHGDLDGLDKSKIVLVKFEDGDPENPLNWSKGRKWLITFLLCAMTVNIGLATTAFSSGIGKMVDELHVINVVGQTGMFAFNGACAVAPLILAPLTEQTGRREVFLGAYACFTLIFILLALSPNIVGEIWGRALSGIFGSCGTILVGGTLADIWNTRERGIPMSCFTFSAIFGTITAPLYCGYIDERIGWRWLEWIHMIANGVLLIAEVILLKETRGAKILLRRAKKLRKETGKNNIRAPMELEHENVKDLLRESCTRAFKLLIGEPVVLAFGLWIAYAWGITFLFLSAIPLAFTTVRGWSEGNTGLAYIPLIIGCFIGFGTSRWADNYYDKKRDENGGVPIPEYRLWGAMYFAWMMPAGLFIFSFTGSYEHVHWMGPMVALVLILVGIYHIFNADADLFSAIYRTYNYTSDSYPEVASSAIAGQGLLRNMFGAATPLFANYMLNGMGGMQYALLFLSLVASLALPLPYVLFKYGERLREKSEYASAGSDLEQHRQTDDNERINERPSYTREGQYTGSFV
ncbi:hypothetical protein JCM8097_006553 [Rhodosporidiobolus ruineniae]